MVEMKKLWNKVNLQNSYKFTVSQLNVKLAINNVNCSLQYILVLDFVAYILAPFFKNPKL